LRNTQELSGIFEQVQKRFRSLDVLVNSAGLLETSEIEQVTEDLWDSVVDVNLKSTFFVTQKALPFLKLGEQARIINISSNAGRMGGYANGPVYAATKGGVIALTYSLARRLAVHGITVNCVAPGTIESEMSRSFGSEERNLLLERFPLKRFGHPEEVATAICYFASLESGFTTGSVLDVNGGLFTG
jgi:3-oxoacyl-[acyl-carrier protein] reductase